MISANKKFLVFSFILIFGLTIAGEVLAVSWLPLVPCGRSGQENCTFCDILHLFKNVFDFLSFEVTPALASVMVAVAGFYILTAGDSPSRLETGKNILKGVVTSLLIIYASWLVINTALTVFAKPTGGGGFFSFTCQAPPTPGTLNDTGGGPNSLGCTANPATLDDDNTTTSFSVKTTASGVTCTWPNPPAQEATYTNGSPGTNCLGVSVKFKDKNGGTVSVPVKDSAGKDIGTASCTVSSSSPGGNCQKATSNDPTLDQLISCIQDKVSGNLGSIITTGGTHSANSCHFGGKCDANGNRPCQGYAVDFGNEVLGGQIISAAQQCGGHGGCEVEGGTHFVPCDSPGVNHVHISPNDSQSRCGCN